MKTHENPNRRAENGKNTGRSVHHFDRLYRVRYREGIIKKPITLITRTTDALPTAAEDKILQRKTPEKRAEEQPPRDSRNSEGGNQLLRLTVLITVVGVLGTLVWDLRLQDKEVPGTEHNAVLGITIFIQAVIAFFGILNLDEPHRAKVSPLTKGGMRSAITGALVVTYLFLVIFHCVVEFTGGTSAATDSFVKNFTWIVGLTITFYFASEAGIHAMNSFKPSRSPSQRPPNHSRPNGMAVRN